MEYGKVSKKMKHKSLMINNNNNKRTGSVGADLHQFDVDRTVTTDPDDNVRRRTLRLTKKDHSWGFTLQTYGIKHKKTGEIEMMTYVDYVEIGGAAWMAGMRRGDVIISVNGEKVGDLSHMQLVQKIRKSGNSVRLVVLFEDCCRKVELHDRFIKLKVVLKEKYEQLKEIELKEMEILDNYCTAKGMNRFEHLRLSLLSRASSGSDSSWDAYSVVSSPKFRKSGGEFPSVSSLRSFGMGDNSSCLDESYENSLCYMDSDSDSDSVIIDDITRPTHRKVHPVAMATRSRTKLICEDMNFSSSDSEKSSVEFDSKCDINTKCENCDTFCDNGCYGYTEGAEFMGRPKSGTLVGQHDAEYRSKSGTITENDQVFINDANCREGVTEMVGNHDNAALNYSNKQTHHNCDHNVNTQEGESANIDNGGLKLVMDHFGDSKNVHEEKKVTASINSKHKGKINRPLNIGRLKFALDEVSMKRKTTLSGLLSTSIYKRQGLADNHDNNTKHKGSNHGNGDNHDNNTKHKGSNHGNGDNHDNNTKHKGSNHGNGTEMVVDKVNGAMDTENTRQKETNSGEILVDNVTGAMGGVNTKHTVIDNSRSMFVDELNDGIGESGAITFHVRDHEVVYINERNEATPL